MDKKKKLNIEEIEQMLDRKLTVAEVYANRPHKWIVYTAIVLIIVTLYCSMGSLVFIISIRRYKYRSHHGKRSKSGGYHITHYISIIVLTCPDISTF